MNVFLLGHRGYLGSYLYKHLNADIFPNYSYYDYVINCIGKPDLEYCQINEKKSFESNYLIVENILQNFPKSKIIHFSSYYVYNDYGYCNENSRTSDSYNYCKHKLMSEKKVIEANGVVFRLGKLFGNLDITKQNKLTEHLLKTDKIVLDEVFFNPTSLSQVCRIIKYILKGYDLSGIFNLSNANSTSHYEYGEFIKKHYNKTLNITKINKHNRIFENYGKFRMSCEKLEKYIELIPWEEDMLQYLGELKCY